METGKPLVLVVDDNPTNINILVDSLKDEYNLGVAKSGTKAMEFARNHNPDLILLDIMMPDIDGYKVCENLKADSHTSDIPVIFISFMDDPDQKTRGFEVGAVDYITKPFHSAEVMARVRTHLLIKQMRETLTEQNFVIEQELSEHRRKLTTLIDNLPGFAFRCKTDDRHTMEYLSDGVLKISGYPPSHFLGSGGASFLLDLTHPDDLTHCQERIEHGLTARESYEMVYRILTEWGEEKWVWEQARGVYDEENELVAIEGLINDVTEQQKQELGVRKENTELKTKIKARCFGNIIGSTAPMQEVFDLILRASSTEDSVIIYGESGTGKELVARAVHDYSKRYDKTFVPVNCGAIPENLFESEFFGYKKGAFTGANMDKKGYLDHADNGTLFLDELGEISLMAQAKLLRAIEGGGFTPVGGHELHTPNLRIIAATNRDLMELVKKGDMRKDFFYRIHVIPIYLPPLRDRKQDIPQLIDHFMQSYPQSESLPSITSEVLQAFMRHDWPGNIRELQNALYQYLTLGRVHLGGTTVGSASSSGRTEHVLQESLTDAMSRFEQEYLHDVLQKNGWHRSKTANILQIDRRTLFRKMKQYGLSD